MISTISSAVGVLSFVCGGLGLYIKLTFDAKLTGITTRIALIEQQQIQHKELLEEMRTMRSDINTVQVQLATIIAKTS